MTHHIFNKATYRGLPVYDQSKAIEGFYECILDRLHALFSVSLNTFSKPLVAHFFIAEPSRDIGRKVGRILKRWSVARHQARGSSNGDNVHFLLVHEIRPRTKQHHGHLAVFFDGLTWYDLLLLEEKLARLSNTREARVFKRDRNRMPMSVDPDTGVIRLDEHGKPVRLTSTYYHNLRQHVEDAFLRMSYLAKVFSKAALHGRPIYSSSHLRRRKHNKQAAEETAI